MEHTQQTKPSKKGHLNFAQMFEDQAKQVEKNAHVQGLLNPNKKVTIENKIETKLDQIEELVKNIQVQNTTPQQTETKIKEKIVVEEKIVKVDYTPKKLYFYTAAIVLAGLFIGIGLNANQNKKPEPIKTVLEPVATVKKADKIWVLTKFGNLRATPSTKGAIITTLAPHLQVKELEEKGQWIKIEFNDLLKDIKLTGWLYKPVMKIVR